MGPFQAKNLLQFIGNLDTDCFEYSAYYYYYFYDKIRQVTNSLPKSTIEKLVKLKSTNPTAYKEKEKAEREWKNIQKKLYEMHIFYVPPIYPITEFVDPYQKVKAQAERLPSLIAQLYNDFYCIRKEPDLIRICNEPAPICILSEQPVLIKLTNIFKKILRKVYFF